VTFSWSKLKMTKREKPLGGTSPWGWIIEPSHGCNLSCGHCCAELIPEEKRNLMTFDIWCSLFKTINAVSPTVRVDICGIVGEPTLHPHLTEWLSVARELAPLVQMQITTNGIALLQEKVNYRDLLSAGANIIYTDQYGPAGKFEQLASESGYPFYQYYDRPAKAWSPWTYYGPQLKMIVLMNPPDTWPRSRLRAGMLGNWCGNLDWEKAKRYNMSPLESSLTRRCNQPFLYVNVASNGNYLLCCMDGMQLTDGLFGNVSARETGFRKFWYGKDLQIIRRHLRNKDRGAIADTCAKCNITYSRCDLKHWTDEELDKWWNGEQWQQLEDH
jgi:hypothetical protein